MFTPFLILAGLWLGGFSPVLQSSPSPQAPVPATASAAPAAAVPSAPAATPATVTTAPSTSSDAFLTNPVHPSAQSQARAKQIYTMDCAMCHGADGSGKGDISQTGKMMDYREASALKGFTDGQIFDIIKNGKGDNMPPEGGRAKPDETWNLVIYLRSFAKPQASAASNGPS